MAAAAAAVPVNRQRPKLALEVAEQALQKSPSSSRKSKPRATQLKLAGIATVQSDQPAEKKLAKQ